MLLLSESRFTPTIATWTGSYRRMIAFLPKQQPMQNYNKLDYGEWQRTIEEITKMGLHGRLFWCVSKGMGVEKEVVKEEDMGALPFCRALFLRKWLLNRLKKWKRN